MRNHRTNDSRHAASQAAVICNLPVLIFQVIVAVILLWHHRTRKPSFQNTTALIYGQEAVRECIRTNAVLFVAIPSH